jgi:hypothetical protein
MDCIICVHIPYILITHDCLAVARPGPLGSAKYGGYLTVSKLPKRVSGGGSPLGRVHNCSRTQRISSPMLDGPLRGRR